MIITLTGDGTTCTPTTSHAIDEDTAATAAATFKALSDPLRLRMLSAIAAAPEGEACVCDLNVLAEVSQPTVSHHLRKLKDAGIVDADRRGTWVYYRLSETWATTITAILNTLATR